MQYLTTIGTRLNFEKNYRDQMSNLTFYLKQNFKEKVMKQSKIGYISFLFPSKH